MKAFISYSSKDAEAAEEVLTALENDGISCFYAPRDIRTGHLYADEIMANMETSDVLVLILSRNSNSSQHVLREAILPTDLVTCYHDPATGDLTEKTTVDKVYIPSMEEVQLLEAADVNLFTAPTEEAIAADSGNLYKMYCEYYNGDTSEWWLRTPLSDSFCELYCVSGGYVEEIYSSNVAALGDVGVRPMMRVKKEYLATH